MASNPKQKQPLDVPREVDAVSDRLREPGYRLRVVDEPMAAAVERTLVDEAPHVLHYIGHGGLSRGEGSLILADPAQQVRWVSGAELARALPSSVRLLCLSTCFTTDNYEVLGLPRVARSASVAYLPNTVTNQYPVEESAVRMFWSVFYDALLAHGGNVNEAVHDARRAVWMSSPDSADWGSFSFVVRDQTGVSFEFEQAPSTGFRRGREFQAQFATQLVNDLAEQLLVLGPDAPPALRKQFERESSRAAQLIDELSPGD